MAIICVRSIAFGCVRTHNSTFEMVEEFKYLGTTLTNQNSAAEEIKSRLRSGNACYHSVQNPLSSRLLFKNLKVKIYRTIILPVVSYGCETWSLTLQEERKLRVFGKMVLRIFGPVEQFAWRLINLLLLFGRRRNCLKSGRNRS